MPAAGLIRIPYITLLGHRQGTLDAADRMVVSRIELANGIHGFSELLKSKAKVAGSQQFRTLAGLAQGYAQRMTDSHLKWH